LRCLFAKALISSKVDVIDDDLIKFMTTVENKVTFTTPASLDRPIANGKRIQVVRTLCLGEALIEDERGKMLAHGISTMRAMRE
jgi:acyl-coenzyme A thioesterase PaaI-like protein